MALPTPRPWDRDPSPAPNYVIAINIAVNEVYTDAELMPWFDKVKEGFPFEEACNLLGYEWKRMDRTIYSDNDVMDWALHLSMEAGYKIRRGLLPVPNRADGLYEEYRDPNNWWVDDKDSK